MTTFNSTESAVGMVLSDAIRHIDGSNLASRHLAMRQVNDEIHVWDIVRLWEDSDSEASWTSLRVSDVDLDDAGAWFFDSERPSPKELVAHMRRIVNADLDSPILLHSDGSILDGLHRVAKASLHNVKSLGAKQFLVGPRPHCILKAKPPCDLLELRGQER